MVKKVLSWITFGTLVLLAVAAVGFLIWRDQRIQYLESNSQRIQTSRGLVEYAQTGSGPSVLVLHGTIGGYDQGQMLVQMLGQSSKRYVSVSRPGYLRTPLDTGATFEQQADAYAALLDELGIDKVAVVAVSGGGPSALQFALRYPNRCWAMVLIAANSDVKADGREDKPNDARQPHAWLMNILFSDLTSWMITGISQIVPDKTLAVLVGQEYVPIIMHDPEKYRNFTEVVSTIVLLSRRREGSINDSKQFSTFTGHPFEKITCPTLILYGTRDNFVPSAEQKYLTKTLPNARYIEIEGGTHFMAVSHQDVLAPLITDFLNLYAP